MGVTRVVNLLHHAVDIMFNKAYGLAPPPEADHFMRSRQTSLSMKLANVRAGRSADTPDHQWPENADPDRYGITPEEAKAQGLIELPNVTAPQRATSQRTTSLSLQGLNTAASGVAASSTVQPEAGVGSQTSAHRRDFH